MSPNLREPFWEHRYPKLKNIILVTFETRGFVWGKNDCFCNLRRQWDWNKSRLTLLKFFVSSSLPWFRDLYCIYTRGMQGGFAFNKNSGIKFRKFHSPKYMERYIPVAQTDPSRRAFGYCSCKLDTKERYWGQQFSILSIRSDQTGQSGPSSKLVSNIPVRPNIYFVPFDVPTKCPECWVERNSNSSLGDLWWRRFAEMLVQSVGSEWPFKITRYIFINFSQRKQNHTGARQADNYFFFQWTRL